MNIINEHVMSDVEVKEIMHEHTDDFVSILSQRVVPELFRLLKNLKPCRQFQMAIMDAESIIDHLESYIQDGPDLNLLHEIPLEASEVSPEAQVNLAPGEELVESYDPMNAGGGTITLILGPAVKFKVDDQSDVEWQPK